MTQDLRTASASARRHDRRVRHLLWGVGLTGSALLGWALLTTATGDHPFDRLVLVVALATLLSEATCVDLRVRRQVESYTWAELVLVVGLVLLPPEHLVLTALGLTTAHLLTRRSLIKVVYNTASHVIGLALALLVTRVVAVPSWDAPAESGLSLTAAVVVFALWNGVSTSAVIALYQGLPFGPVYRRGARLRVVVAAGNLGTGLAVLALWHVNPVALLALPGVLAALYLAYRTSLHLLQERNLWRHVEATSREISRLDEREIAEVAVVRGAVLLDADEVEVCLLADAAPGGTGRRDAQVYLGDAHGVRSVQTGPGCGPGDGTVSSSPEPVRQEGDQQTSVSVPLPGRDGQLGWLTVRYLARVRCTSRELQLLESFAHTVGSHLSNARLYADMREQAARNESAALHDALTGLPNRVLLRRRAQELIAGHGQGARDFALLLVDLDHFKEVNDTLGHQAGDTLLCEVASRLRAGVRGEDVVCRLGGDEFAVLLTDASGADRTAARLVDLLAEPVEVDGLRLAVGGSVGVAVFPDDAANVEELLQRADVAMYQAKVARGSYRRYSSERDGSSVDRLSLVAELRTALAEGQLRVHFQPKHDLRSGRPVGAEALVRWEHPQRGLLPPDQFVPVIEGSALLREFTRQVLDLAVAECAAWQARGGDLTVAVNLSARSVDDPALADDVAEVLRRYELPADRLVLEITETAIIGDIDAVAEQAARLRDLGVVLSIDDFGTGHSSLTILQRIAVHELKIDRSFVVNILENEGDATITRATVQLARGLGLRTVAEGVEDAQVLEHLVDLRCDTGQGYHWSPAVPAAEVRVLLDLEASATVA